MKIKKNENKKNFIKKMLKFLVKKYRQRIIITSSSGARHQQRLHTNV